MNARDKMPFEVTPIFYKLQRYDLANVEPPPTGPTAPLPAPAAGADPQNGAPAAGADPQNGTPAGAGNQPAAPDNNQPAPPPQPQPQAPNGTQPTGDNAPANQQPPSNAQSPQ
jgi:hypothetical protein